MDTSPFFGFRPTAVYICHYLASRGFIVDIHIPTVFCRGKKRNYGIILISIIF